MEPREVSARQLGEILGLNERTVRDLVDRGVVTRTGRGRYDLFGSILAYVEHLRAVAAGRGGEAASYDLTRERARLAKEQADERELRNATLRGELVEVEAVKREWTDILRSIRSRVLSVPSRVRQSLPHLTGHDVERIDGELRRALEEAARDE
ncbi:terminase small subunit [Paracoccus yeei]|uniref:terminase small subunit n=1 Tax=Paracoccus yeei TaxID=147645 RepID=UPI00174C95B0|nr:terminase small subunit [Paracoccus yeei]